MGEVQVIRQAAHVIGKVNLRQILGLVELFMNKRHRVDAHSTLPEHGQCRIISDAARLEVQHARNYLQVILDPMVNLL